MEKCEFCKTEKFENWKGNAGLKGRRCKNKDLISYTIETVYIPVHHRTDLEEEERLRKERERKSHISKRTRRR